ncbi:MAG: hypothetical protein ACOC0P_04580 [Planctomycetota bacterium]
MMHQFDRSSGDFRRQSSQGRLRAKEGNAGGYFHNAAAIVACIVILSGLLSHNAEAHQPHDVIDALGISPDFDNDSLVLVAVTAGIYSAPMRSTDGGVTFERIIDGMDNSGTITSFAFSPDFASDSTVYMSSLNDGIYRSEDLGLTWEKINGNLPVLMPTNVTAALDPEGNRFLLTSMQGGGLFRSSDDGATWTSVSAFESSGIFAIESIRLSNNVSLTYVGTARGELWLSEDGAETFTRLVESPTINPIFSISLSPNFERDRALVVSTEKLGILQSTDGGATFRPANNGILERWVNDVEFSPNFASDRTLFACTYNLAVYRSTNAGRTWELFSEGIRYQEQFGARGHFFDIAVSPNFREDGTVMLGAWEGYYLSTDRGETWIEAETRPTSSITGIELSPGYPVDQRLVMTRYGGGTRVSDDFGQTWIPTTFGITNPYVYDLDISPQFDLDDTVFALYIGAVARSNDGGNSWESVRIIDEKDVFPKSLAISDTFQQDQTVFTGSRLDGVFRSTDGGDEWEQVFFIRGGDIVEVDLSPNYVESGEVLLGVVDYGAVYSDDRGETWMLMNDGLDDVFRVRPRFSPSYLADGLVFAASTKGLYRTESLGTWQKADGPDEIRNGNIEFIEFSPQFTTDRTMFVSIRGRGLYRSTDAGLTWSTVATNLFDHGIEVKLVSLSPNYATDGTMIVSSDDTLWFSQDRGASWTEIPTGQVRYENYNQQVDFTGPEWRVQIGDQFSAGNARVSFVPGHRVQFTFIGQSMTWIGARARQLGLVEVYLDGQLLDTIDLYAETPEIGVPLYTIDGLDPDGRYVFEIVILDEKNPDAVSFGALIDAFDVTP